MKDLTGSRWVAMAMVLALAAAAFAEKPKVAFNEAQFRDKVYACWLGKNIGGTLGMPFEGKKEAQNISFYTKLKEGEPVPNDDLDLQLLWLKAMEDHDGTVDACILGEYWLQYVPVDWNEYGVGKKNMRQGILPPLSGEYNNAQWKHSNGAWIRSEIWACLFPGCPAMAAKFAREDACVDHGAAEGTLAEIFTAALESAAFVEHDRDKLLAIALSMIPEKCGVSRAVRAAIDANKAGKDWKAAREAVVQASEGTGWFQAPRNVAFTMIGWLYGEDDFGRSLCIAVNCGDDTDCTGATLGSLLGIIHGTAGIPEKWSKPVGVAIKNVAIKGFDAPKDIKILTDKTLAMTKKVIAKYNLPVAIGEGPADLSKASELVLSDPAAAKELWDLSPYRIVCCGIALDYVSEPTIRAGVERIVNVTIGSPAPQGAKWKAVLAGVPEGWTVRGLPEGGEMAAGKQYDLAFTAPVIANPINKMTLDVSCGGTDSYCVPITLIDANYKEPSKTKAAGPRVGADDLALASKGAAATADSEYDKAPSAAAKAIDGVVCGSTDFERNRWHSALTPHPHWIEIKLAKPARIDRVVIHWADPAGYGVDFKGFVSPEGKADRAEIFTVKDSKEPRTSTLRFAPVTAATFRLVIEKSASEKYPHAAQVSEIEILPAK